MNAYTDDQERNIRVQRLVADWTKSGLLTEAQREQISPELQVDLRRTNLFMRLTMFVFGFLILQSFTFLLALAMATGEFAGVVLCAAASAGSFAIANMLVTRSRFYRFGIEEAAAIAAIGFAIASVVLFIVLIDSSSESVFLVSGLLVGAAASAAVFLRFGYVYAAVAALICLAAAPFVPGDSDMWHRLASIAVLAVAFALARAARRRAGHEFPADSYAFIEAAAWIGIYLATNLRISSWISQPDEVDAFYWATYAATWLLPVIGLWIAIRDRHRMMLDVSIVMAIITVSTNKAYLGSPRYPYDPIAFGVLLVAVAIGLKRWLAAGEGGARNGFIAERLLESEKARLGVLGTVSVMHQGPVASRPEPAAPPTIGGGGSSGGAGATGSF